MLLHTLQFYNFVGRLFTSPIETCMTKNTSLTSIQIDQTVISVVILIKATSQGKIYLDSIVSSRIGVFIIVHENALARLSPPSDTNFTTDKQPTKTWNVKRKRTTDYVKLTSQPSEVSLVAKVLQKSQLCCHKFGVKSWNLSPILPVITLLRSSVYKARLQQRRLESTAAQSCWETRQNLYGIGGQLEQYRNYLLWFYSHLFWSAFSFKGYLIFI